MNLSKSFIEHGITEFEGAKQYLTSIGLDVKDTPKDPNLNSLFIVNNNNNLDTLIARECNGLILKKSDLSIVYYSFPKSLDLGHNISEEIDTSTLLFEHSLDATRIGLFWYNNKWNICTKKCMNALFSKWSSSKSFGELFIESVTDYQNFLLTLNSECCYTFLLNHPEIISVSNSESSAVYNISIRNMNSLEEIDDRLQPYFNIKTLNRIPVSQDNIPQLMDSIKMCADPSFQGYILIDASLNRHKIFTTTYIRARELLGNSNNLFFRFLQLRKTPEELTEYVKYFKKHLSLFLEYENKLEYLAINIFDVYCTKHIKKSLDVIPQYLKTIIYKIHGKFLETHVKTTVDTVRVYLLEIDEPIICKIFNDIEKEKICEALSLQIASGLEAMDI